ncbi:hypothetical protein, partial [Pseudomonas syringae group genomosp. 7]|uniref:hypothetical protein n=1 Tax=Pseudomonas syringae group genomosp. 7 TaxID=251699 RepID=UPI00376F57EF
LCLFLWCVCFLCVWWWGCWCGCGGCGLVCFGCCFWGGLGCVWVVVVGGWLFFWFFGCVCAELWFGGVYGGWLFGLVGGWWGLLGLGWCGWFLWGWFWVWVGIGRVGAAGRAVPGGTRGKGAG